MNAITASPQQADATPTIRLDKHGWGEVHWDDANRRCVVVQRWMGAYTGPEPRYQVELQRYRIASNGQPICHDVMQPMQVRFGLANARELATQLLTNAAH